MTINDLIERLEEYCDEIGDVDEDAILYIVEGQQLGYGTKRAWEVAMNCKAMVEAMRVAGL